MVAGEWAGGKPWLVEFLNRLVRQSKRKEFLIVDRHPVHRSPKVKQWLQEHRDKMRLFFFPAIARN
ncbi:MAG: hypothetical protein FJ126_04485 [Deltaproteobacteria bacterium]|nr:hypothetical protein [Deltaproteobacteria bacterium]